MTNVANATHAANARRMKMHDWSDPNVDWLGINDAAYYIGHTLRVHGRIQVRDFKEKWGTVRIYCSFGWWLLHDITHPGHAYCRYPKWLWKLDCTYGRYIVQPLNYIVIPWQKWMYRKLYKNAIYKWPHLRKEILCCADWPEILEGL